MKIARELENILLSIRKNYALQGPQQAVFLDDISDKVQECYKKNKKLTGAGLWVQGGGTAAGILVGAVLLSHLNKNNPNTATLADASKPFQAVADILKSYFCDSPVTDSNAYLERARNEQQTAQNLTQTRQTILQALQTMIDKLNQTEQAAKQLH